jgi:hypothetical protein
MAYKAYSSHSGIIIHFLLIDFISSNHSVVSASYSMHVFHTSCVSCVLMHGNFSVQRFSWIFYAKSCLHFIVEKMSSERLQKVIETVTRLQDFERRMCQLDVNETEYAYLKFLALFCPGLPLCCDSVGNQTNRQSSRCRNRPDRRRANLNCC